MGSSNHVRGSGHRTSDVFFKTSDCKRENTRSDVFSTHVSPPPRISDLASFQGPLSNTAYIRQLRPWLSGKSLSTLLRCCLFARKGGGSHRASLLPFPFLLSILEWSDTHVYDPEIQALIETASHFCEVVVLKSRTTVRVLVEAADGEEALLAVLHTYLYI